MDNMELKPMQLKGVMLDMARVTEDHDYYWSLPERLARWGYNTLLAHFNDDQGCAMQFQSRPELATAHALTKKQMREWIALAGSHGIMVVPEIESFGHTHFIHGLEKYRHLREPTTGVFNAINPLHPQTHEILSDLVEEVAEVFDAPFIHAGLDEVNFGGSDEVREALRTREKYEIFADHINFMHERVTRTGRRMMMWADHLTRPRVGEPRLADLIPKDIVMCHWLYERSMPPEQLRLLVDKGFDVICAPASLRYGDILMPGATTQVNLQRFAHVAHQDGPHVVGLLNTVWETGRMLCGIEQFALALGGAWFDDPAADPVGVLTRFAADHFGLSDADAQRVGEAILSLSAHVTGRAMFFRLIGIGPVETPDNPLTACEVNEARHLLDQVGRVREVLLSSREHLRQNESDYDNFLLAADILAWACEVGLSRTAGYPGDQRRELRDRGQSLVERCRADWNRGRYEDDPKRESAEGNGWQFLIPNLVQAVTRLEERTP